MMEGGTADLFHLQRGHGRPPGFRPYADRTGSLPARSGSGKM